MIRRLIVLTTAGAAALAGLAGCAVATTSTPAAQPAKAHPAAWTTAAATPAKPSSGAPALTNTGTAWPKVIGSMIAYGQWLEANPNPALATTITEPGCASANALIGSLQSLVDQGAYMKTSAPVLSSVSGPVSSTPAVAGSQVTVDIQASRPAEQVLDRKTATKTVVLSDQAQLPPTALKITLILGTDKKWRFCGVADVLNDPDGEVITTLL
ncbi:hypothetical protein KOI35_31110 [Actinoplanes bogorensis]|uniref:Uncharacterized protein n=1 Tax=Paractinoplanes bogorensis TaxID=1610840 RepID=A0ABS5YX01_9ACTN|nr:hypothetical protein [Actinoplanes bogorensis]MBU2667970.1 hypothetical protein [Actinoplanes bogorensis]